MAKDYAEIFGTPPLTAAFCYLDAPDDKAPENADFKPDGKFKLTLVADNLAALKKIETKVRAGATKKWGADVDFETFKFPWREYDDDARDEGLRGKVTITPKTKNKPKIVGPDRRPLADGITVRSGDLAAAAVSLYFYAGTETVRVGKKTEQVPYKGCSLQLWDVQLVEKRNMSGGGMADVFGTYEPQDDDSADDAVPHTGADDDADF